MHYVFRSSNEFPLQVGRLERRSFRSGPGAGTRIQSERSSSIDSTDEDSKFDDPSLTLTIAPVSPVEPPKTSFGELGEKSIPKDANMNNKVSV